MTSSFPPAQLEQVTKDVVNLLLKRKETLSCAETSTGGLLSACILSQPGTSACFTGSVAAYGLKARTHWLGWTEHDTANYDGPTEQIVENLAVHLNQQFETDYTLAESGATGPSLPTKYRAEIDTTGYCPLALVTNHDRQNKRKESGQDALGGGPGGAGRTCKTKTVRVPDQPRDRSDNMVQFVKAALEMLLDELQERESKEGGKL